MIGLSAITAAVLAGSVAVAAPASAIQRTEVCDSGSLIIHSPATTCWAEQGSVRVRLYSVSSASGGGFNGYLLDADGHTKFSFYKGKTTKLPAPVRTIVTIVIFPTDA